MNEGGENVFCDSILDNIQFGKRNRKSSFY